MCMVGSRCCVGSIVALQQKLGIDTVNDEQARACWKHIWSWGYPLFFSSEYAWMRIRTHFCLNRGCPSLHAACDKNTDRPPSIPMDRTTEPPLQDICSFLTERAPVSRAVTERLTLVVPGLVISTFPREINQRWRSTLTQTQPALIFAVCRLEGIGTRISPPLHHSRPSRESHHRASKVRCHWVADFFLSAL